MERLFMKLKHWFIAHEGNDHRPHILRDRALLVIGGLVLLFEAVSFLQSSSVVSRSKFLGDILSSVLISQTNEHRAEAAIRNLAPNPLLEAAAAMKAKDMAEKGYFAHVSPEGVTPWYWLKEAGYKYSYAGENLAVNFSDSKDVTDAWMNSPGHRANILNGNFTEIGIATAKGMYQGREVVFVVELFGTPVRPVAVSPKASPTPKPPVAIEIPKAEPQPVIAPQPAVQGSNFTSDSAELAETAEAASAPAEVPTVKERLISQAYGFLAHPSGPLNYIVLVLAILIGCTLIAKLTRVGMMHPRLVAKGMFMLLLFVAVAFMNHYVLVAHALVP